MIIALAVAAAIQAAPSADAVARARDVLELGLVDYPSARFREVRVVTRPSNQYVSFAVCGMVNSRTRSGGYAGWSRFTIRNDRLEIDDGDALFRRGWAVWCEGADVVTVHPDITADVTPEQP